VREGPVPLGLKEDHSNLVDDIFALGRPELLFLQPIADSPTTMFGRLRSFRFKYFLFLGYLLGFGGFGPPDQFPDADLAVAGEQLVDSRGLRGLVELAEKRGAAVQGVRELAQADSGLMDLMDGACAVQII